MSQKEAGGIKPLHFIRSQATSAAFIANKEVSISGRGSGKSTDIGWRMNLINKTMPRSSTVISGESYAQLLSITLAPVLGYLEQLGYYRNVHYVIGKPPASWKTMPYQPPPDFSRCILTKEGTCFPLASQDRPGMSRGRNIDGIIGDEMLTQNKEQYEKEILASKRGNMQRFKDNPLYLGYYLKSSMPIGVESQWLLDYSKYYEDDGYDMWGLWNDLAGLQLQFVDNCINKDMPDYVKVQTELIAQMAEAKRKIRFYKSKEGVLFTCYNAFENLKNVGIEYIIEMRRTMSDLVFRIEILNERITAVEGGFYNIDKRHLYTKYDNDVIDNCDYDFDKIKGLHARMDGDVIRTKALDIGIDFGAAINALVAGQAFNETEYRFLKSLYTKNHQGLKKLIDDFCNYYKDHKYKVVNLFYDQTATGTHNVTLTHVQNTILYFKKHGWSVVPKYIGAAPEHMLKYELWQQLLKEDSAIKIFFNKDNFKDALVSMTMAEIKEGEKGFKKDKSVERRSSVPRERATDLSDAADLVAWGRFSNKVKTRSTFVDMRSL
jgi:hypothetical protein